jgi:hypothetical protein
MEVERINNNRFFSCGLESLPHIGPPALALLRCLERGDNSGSVFSSLKGRRIVAVAKEEDKRIVIGLAQKIDESNREEILNFLSGRGAGKEVVFCGAGKAAPEAARLANDFAEKFSGEAVEGNKIKVLLFSTRSFSDEKNLAEIKRANRLIGQSNIVSFFASETDAVRSFTRSCLGQESRYYGTPVDAYYLQDLAIDVVSNRANLGRIATLGCLAGLSLWVCRSSNLSIDHKFILPSISIVGITLLRVSGAVDLLNFDMLPSDSSLAEATTYVMNRFEPDAGHYPLDEVGRVRGRFSLVGNHISGWFYAAT